MNRKEWEKYWDEDLKHYVCLPDWLTNRPNRTALLPKPYNNESFPVPWLVIKFEVHIGFPVLILYGFIPLLTSWVLLSLHGCKDALDIATTTLPPFEKLHDVWGVYYLARF